MKARLAALLLLLSVFARSQIPVVPAASPQPVPVQTKGEGASAIVVVGIAGDEEYAPIFADEAARWEKICAQAGARCRVIGRAAGTVSDRDLLKQALESEPREGSGKLWLILIGHGTFGEGEAKFNLRGPDVSAADLALWLGPFHRPLAVIDTSSSSAPFLKALSAPGRVIITATRSGEEQNYARFGHYLALALDDPQSDLDKDGQVSLLEAFLGASARLAEFYKTQGRLATEHPLIDDNGDGLGTPPDWFQGVRAVRKARDGAAADGPLAQQFVLLPSTEERKLPPELRARRDALELEVARLREDKDKLPEGEYYARLETILLKLAAVYEEPSLGADQGTGRKPMDAGRTP